MKNTLKSFLPLVVLPSFVFLTVSCDSNTPLGVQNDVLGNAEFTIPEVLIAGDEINIKSFVLTRPLDLTLTIESGATLSYYDSRFPEGVEPFANIPYTYTSASTTRTLSFSRYDSAWDVTDDMGTDDTDDDVNKLEELLQDATADDENIRLAAITYGDTMTKENAQALLEALSLNQDLRDINMVFDRQGTEVRVFRSLSVTLQLDGSSNLDRVGVPLSVSLAGKITRNPNDTSSFPTGFTYTPVSGN